MTKTFIIDTNVLIHDPKCIYKFKNNDIAIPLIVLDEIDGLKKGKSSVSQSARQVSRELDELRSKGKLHKGVTLETGGTLSVITDLPKPQFDPLYSKEYKNDDVLLQLMIKINKQELFENPILITEDINLRIRAEVFDIDVQRYKNSAIQDSSLYDPCSIKQISKQDMSSIYNQKMKKIVGIGDGPINEYLVFKNNKSNSALVQRVAKNGYQLVESPGNVFGVRPRNKEQIFAFDALLNPKIELVVLSGKSGTGKTLCSLAAGFSQVTESTHNFKTNYDAVTVARPIVPLGKDLGYLPGEIKEKLEPWMSPIWDNINFLIKSKSKTQKSAQYFLEQSILNVEALTYIRGRSIPNEFIIIDEAQNLSPHEIKTILTRAGKGTKVVLTGDPYQIDNPYLDTYNNGLSYVIDRMKGKDNFAEVTLHKGERSRLAEMAADLL